MKKIDCHVHEGQTCHHPASGWLASRDPAAGLFSGLPLRAPSTSPGSGPESTCAQPQLFSLSPSGTPPSSQADGAPIEPGWARGSAVDC